MALSDAVEMGETPPKVGKDFKFVGYSPEGDIITQSTRTGQYHQEGTLLSIAETQRLEKQIRERGV